MCTFDIPFLLYYSNIPALVVGILLGVFVVLSGKKSLVKRNLLFILFIFWLGTLNSMLQWMIHDVRIAFFLSKLSIFESLALLFFIYFAYAFIGENLSLKKKLIFLLPFVPFLIFFNNPINSYIVDAQTCTFGYGSIFFYMYLVVFVYMVLAIRKLRQFSRQSKDEKVKNQVEIIIGAIAFIVIWIIALVTLSGVFMGMQYEWGEQLLLFIPFGLTLFVGLLVFAITRYQLLNMRLVAAQALTYFIWLLIASQYLFADSFVILALISLTLLLSVVFGIMLIHAIKREIERKEELEKLSVQLVKANKELTKLDSAKSEFISIASHQLRTPLTAIKGFVSMLMEGSFGKVSGEMEQALGKVYVSNERLINLVEDMLNVSRIEAGRMNYSFEPVQLKDIVKELSDTFGIAAREKNLSLALSPFAKNIPTVWADRIKIREVISNLIDNAIKYTKKGKVDVKVQKIKSGVRVTVSDTGVGVDPEEASGLFDKFVRGSESSKLFTNGTGLGLYMGKKIVEAHKGKIWAESRGPGKGSKFIVELSSYKPKSESSKVVDEKKSGR